jgi:hypothetical protein
MADDGIQVSIDFTKLSDWEGALSDVMLPVYHKATGNKYKIDANNVLIGTDDVLTEVSATEGTVTNIPSMHDKTMKWVFRATSFAGRFVAGTSPGEMQVGWDNTNNDLTCPPGQPWTGGEKLTIVHKP